MLWCIWVCIIISRPIYIAQTHANKLLQPSGLKLVFGFRILWKITVMFTLHQQTTTNSHWLGKNAWSYKHVQLGENAHSKQAKKQRCSLMMPWLSVESWELSSSSPADAIRLIMFMDELMYWRFINTVVWGWGWKPSKRNEAAEVIVWHKARKQRCFYYASTPSGRIWCRISERIRQFKIRSEHQNMRSWISTKRPRITRQQDVINQIPSAMSLKRATSFTEQLTTLTQK